MTETDHNDGAITRAEVCCIAVAEAFRGDGERLCNPIGIIPMIGGRLARESFEPDLVMTDGFGGFAANPLPPGADPAGAVLEAWNPYPQMFSVLWNGRRHVMMGATQVDRFGNQNIAAIGSWEQPRSQLLGFRGAPGNTINHTTSYWVPNHSPKVFVPEVDVVCGIGYDRAAEIGPTSARFHEIRRVVSNLAVFGFAPASEGDPATMTLLSVHPGVSVDDVVSATRFELQIPDDVPTSRGPEGIEIEELERIDPEGLRFTEVPDA